jgi:hypothetical protein
MRNLALRLEAERCTDGAEIVRLRKPSGIRSPFYGAAGRIWFSYRSDRYGPFIREAVNLEDTLVVRFVNAADDHKRVDFLSRFGLPEGLSLTVRAIGFPAEPLNWVLGAQRELRHLLRDAGSGDASRAAKAARRSLHLAGDSRFSLRSDGRVAVTVRSLISFMRLEIAMVAENGARIASCKRCGNFFLYGKGTKRRSTAATYCRDLCRVGAYRANKRGS